VQAGILSPSWTTQLTYTTTKLSIRPAKLVIVDFHSPITNLGDRPASTFLLFLLTLPDTHNVISSQLKESSHLSSSPTTRLAPVFGIAGQYNSQFSLQAPTSLNGPI
jgi:hypothetical protein